MAAPLAAQVIARRKSYRFTLEQATELVTAAKPAELRAGFADHPVRDSMVNRLAAAAMPDQSLAAEDFLRLRALCLFGALDGHTLARLAHGKRQRPRAFANAGAATRFVSQAAECTAQLLEGPLGETARALAKDWVKLAPRKQRDRSRASIEAAIALGALIYVFEQDLDPLAFAGVSPKSRPRAEKSPLEPRHLQPPRELLQKVLDAPADDAPRLVLADWLSERGDPRGELIELQCRLGRGTFGAGARYVDQERSLLDEEARRPLDEREKALLELHEKRWVAPVRKYVRTWGFRRGFLDRVLCDARLFFDGLGALSNEPIEKAKLTAWVPQLNVRVHREPRHPTLWLLDLSQNRLDATELELLGSAFCSRLRGLELWGNRFGDAGAGLLKDFAPAGLERLNLARTELTDEGLKTLSRAPWWPTLTHLDLSFNDGIGDGAAESLARCEKLEWVTFLGCGLTDRGARALAELKLPSLQHLCAPSAGVGNDGALALVRSSGLTGLKRLDLPWGTGKKVLAEARARFGPPAPPEQFHVQHFFY